MNRKTIALTLTIIWSSAFLHHRCVLRSNNEKGADGDDIFPLWSGSAIEQDPRHIPFVKGIAHSTIHTATKDGYKFLHGAAITNHNGIFFANWANSPSNENGPEETLQGRRSSDDCVTWSPLETVGPGFEGPERHSHGVFLEHKNELWTICARFGEGTDAKKFDGLNAEAFVLNEKLNKWESRGLVMQDCWPLEAIKSMKHL